MAPRVVVYVRRPRCRDGIEDPPTVLWTTEQERQLWAKLRSSTSDVDWASLARQFGVSVLYILQQTAWLYEKEMRLLQERMSRINANASVVKVPVNKRESQNAEIAQRWGGTEPSEANSTLPGNQRTPTASSLFVGGSNRIPSSPVVPSSHTSTSVSTRASQPVSPSPWDGPMQSLRSQIPGSTRARPRSANSAIPAPEVGGRRLLSASRTIESDDSSTESISDAEDFVPANWSPDQTNAPEFSSSTDVSVTQSELEDALMELDRLNTAE